MASPLPADWREQLVEMIRGAAPLQDAWFTGGPVCTPMEQIAIYADQYRLRLFDALVEEARGVRHLLPGDDGAALLHRYLLENPSRSFTLNRVADALPEWLARQPGVARTVVEMAHLDRAVQKGFEAAEGTPLDPATLVTLPALQLQPHVSLLRLRSNVHEIRSAVLTGASVPASREGDFPLVVFRRENKMRHWAAPLALWGILDAIERGASVPAAIDEVFARGWVDTETLQAEIGGWFRDLAERQLVAVKGSRS